MIRPSLREALGNAPLLCSTFVKMPSLEVVDLLAASSLDFIVIDLEHSQLDEGDARRLIRHAAANGLPAVVRVSDVDPGQVNRCLEAGAAGIQLSTVRSEKEAKALSAACSYPPAGERSLSVAHPAAGYGRAGIAAYLRDGTAPVRVGQIETASTEDSLADICAHLDVLFIGLTDLSLSLGHPGDYQHPKLLSRVDEIARAAEVTGTVLGGWAPSLGSAGVLLDRGARYLTVSSDITALASGIALTFTQPPAD